MARGSGNKGMKEKEKGEQRGKVGEEGRAGREKSKGKASCAPIEVVRSQCL